MKMEAGNGEEDKSAREANGSNLRFRAIMTRGARRGIRLEDLYWQTLEEMALAAGKKLGELIADISEPGNDTGNVTAALRFAALQHVRSRLEKAENRGGRGLVIGLVNGAPGAAFVLSGNKKIISYNPPFLALVQTRLSQPAGETLSGGLRLQLDLPFDGLIARLRADPETPIPCGYTLATSERVVRGRLTAVLAPLAGEDAIIGYVIQ